jgi:glucosamine--fructose-6-phosphate aminotransferase (isomerizing)
MCGIFGIISNKKISIYNNIINGLTQLQNRGYDSSGFCVLKNKLLKLHKFASTKEETSIQKLINLNLQDKEDKESTLEEDIIYQGIGHNRWATHGAKNDINAHPHISNDGTFSIVHNGIIENYSELKSFLINKGYTFYSQTDTEVIVNLISYYYNELSDIFKSIENVIEKLQGTYGIIIIHTNSPNTLYCVRNGSPLLVGENEDCVIITSEQSGFCNNVNNYITLNNDDICVIDKNSFNKINIKTTHVYCKNKVNVTNEDITPYPYNHWTIKEIYEQPNVILNAINRGGRIQSNANVKLGGLEEHMDVLKKIDNIIILGCGTSYYAGLYGMYYFKNIGNFNTVQVFDGAEFNIYDIPKLGNTAVLFISQSGETKDLHRCIEIVKSNNLFTIGIINVVDSLIAREVDCGIYCNAGREVGVASTKAFTSQVVCLSLLAIWFAQIKNINELKRKNMILDLHNLSNDFKNNIEKLDAVMKEISLQFKNCKNMFLLGKGSDEYIAKEGSLKIKELSYIHSEGYSASSLKHGPFALLDEDFPVIIFNLDDIHTNKIINCIEEVYSRKSPILLITSELKDNVNIKNKCSIVNILKNKTYSSLMGIAAIQLLAYYLSVNQNINPDIPKNLAKVVSVE